MIRAYMKSFTFAGDYFCHPPKMEVHEAAFGVEVFDSAISVFEFHKDLKNLFLDIAKAVHKGSGHTLETLNIRLVNKIDQLSDDDLGEIIKNSDNLIKLQFILDVGRMIVDMNLNTEIKNTLSSIESITQENKKSLAVMESAEKNIEKLTSENINLLKAIERTETNIKRFTWIVVILTLFLIAIELSRISGIIKE